MHAKKYPHESILTLHYYYSHACYSCSGVNYDMKCNKPDRCWYCSGLCDICLKPASFGLTSEEEDGTVLRFCSEPCQSTHKIRFSPVKSQQPAFEVCIPPSTPPPHFRAFPIGSSHKLLLSISAEGGSPRGNYTQLHMAVCAGDGKDGLPADKLYVACFVNELDHPIFLEFFITDAGEPEMPLPYCLCPTSIALTEMFRKTNQVKNLLSAALLSKEIPSLHCLKNNEGIGKRQQAHKHHTTADETFQVLSHSKGTRIDHIESSHQIHVDALPEQFVVCPVANPSTINLPKGHRILLHENISNSSNSGDTLFIAIGNCDPYTPDRPYLINHHYRPHTVINIGYFISPDCSAQEFLPDMSPKEALKDIAESELIKNLQSQYPHLLPQLIQSKGFINLSSLMKHAQTQRSVIQITLSVNSSASTNTPSISTIQILVCTY